MDDLIGGGPGDPDDLLDTLLGDGGDGGAGGAGGAAPEGGGGAREASGAAGAALEAVSAVAEHLNERHRQAKHVSEACGRVFLSLLFAGEAPRPATAVVESLRDNGALVYLPDYGLRLPLFLSDRFGVVQLDPAAVGLPSDAGAPPTAGFAAVPTCRALPQLSLRRTESALEVVGGAGGDVALRVREGDVLTVLALCDLNEEKARVPRVRVHLHRLGEPAAAAAPAAAPAPPRREQRQWGREVRGFFRGDGAAREHRSIYGDLQGCLALARGGALRVRGRAKKALTAERVGCERLARGRMRLGGFAGAAGEEAEEEEEGAWEEQGAAWAAQETADPTVMMRNANGGEMTSTKDVQLFTRNNDRIAHDALRRQRKLKVKKRQY